MMDLYLEVSLHCLELQVNVQNQKNKTIYGMFYGVIHGMSFSPYHHLYTFAQDKEESKSDFEVMDIQDFEELGLGIGRKKAGKQ